MRTCLTFIALSVLQAVAFAEAGSIPESQITRKVTAEGACAIVGMNAEQAQKIALQQARARAIEQVAGVSVSSSTLVTDFKAVAYFVLAYTKGVIVREEVEYPPAGQYQKDSSTAPIIEYRVRIVADVYIPERRIKPIGLDAKINNSVYRKGEKMWVEVNVGRKAKIAIFNIMADDRIAMLFPNEYEKSDIVSEKTSVVFPGKNSPVELVVHTLKGHNRDAEAILVVALDPESARDFDNWFVRNETLAFAEFFRKYAGIADYAENTVLVYEIVSGP